MLYQPAVWTILEFSGTKLPRRYRRILAGWYGGVGQGDALKLSSGVDRVIDKGVYWEIINISGNMYICHKNCEGFSSMTSKIYTSICESNSEEIFVKHVNRFDNK